MSLLFGGKTISRKTQRPKYIHIIIIILLCTLSSLWLLWKFTFEWSDLRRCEEQSPALEWWDRTTSRSRWTADLSIMMEDCWLRIRFYIFWLAPLCRPWSEDFQLYLSALLSSPASPLWWFYFSPLWWFLFFGFGSFFVFTIHDVALNDLLEESVFVAGLFGRKIVFWVEGRHLLCGWWWWCVKNAFGHWLEMSQNFYRV